MEILRGPLEMLTSIQFDDDFCDADEVADVEADWVLPPELVAIELPSTQMTPQATFSLRLVLAQLAGEVEYLDR